MKTMDPFDSVARGDLAQGRLSGTGLSSMAEGEAVRGGEGLQVGGWDDD